MKKIILALASASVLALALAFFPVPCLSQTSTLGGTITDANGQVYANGSYSITFRPVPGIGGSYLTNPGGVSFTKSYTGSLDSTGSFSGVVVQRNDYISPANSTWTVQVCPQATAQCFSTDVYINTASMNLTSVITPPGISVSPISLPLAYSDNEIIPTNLTGAYRSLTDNTIHFCTVASNLNNLCTQWSATVASSSLPAFTSTSLEGIEFADRFSGSDGGAQIQNALNSLPSGGGTVYVPSGTYTSAHTITISGSNETLACSPGATIVFAPTGTISRANNNDRAIMVNGVTTGPLSTINSAIATGATSFVSATTPPTLAQGQWIIVRELDPGPGDYTYIDWEQVASVSGNTITVVQPFRTAFPLSSGHTLQWFEVNPATEDTISGCSIISSYDLTGVPGISISYSRGTRVVGNTITLALGQPLYTYETSLVDLSHNIINGSTPISSEVAESVDVSFVDNSLGQDESPQGLGGQGSNIDFDLGTAFFNITGNQFRYGMASQLALYYHPHDGIISGNYFSYTKSDGTLSQAITGTGASNISISSNYFNGGGSTSYGLNFASCSACNPAIASSNISSTGNLFGAQVQTPYSTTTIPALNSFDHDSAGDTLVYTNGEQVAGVTGLDGSVRTNILQAGSVNQSPFGVLSVWSNNTASGYLQHALAIHDSGSDGTTLYLGPGEPECGGAGRVGFYGVGRGCYWYFDENTGGSVGGGPLSWGGGPPIASSSDVGGSSPNYVQTTIGAGDTVTADATAFTDGTYTWAANTFCPSVGQVYHLYWGGEQNITSSGYATGQAFLGSTAITGNGSYAGIGDEGWTLNAELICTATGSSGAVEVIYTASSGVSGFTIGIPASFSVNTTASVTISLKSRISGTATLKLAESIFRAY